MMKDTQPLHRWVLPQSSARVRRVTRSRAGVSPDFESAVLSSMPAGPSFGTGRVQFSVFECTVNEEQWVRLRGRLLGLIDEKKDSLRFYNLGEESSRRIEHHGIKATMDPQGILLV